VHQVRALGGTIQSFTGAFLGAFIGTHSEFQLQATPRDIERTVSQDKVLELATDRAASFYEDDFLEATDVEFRIDPLRFWLVTFKKAQADEEFYTQP